MQATLICITDSDKHFASAFTEYQKRLAKRLSIINCKPIKHGSKQQIITAETHTLIERVSKISSLHEYTVLLLSKEGTQRTTDQWRTHTGAPQKTICIIGGPYGLDEALLTTTIPQIRRIALGAQTMPHGLARLVLIEQLYRVHMIEQNRSYHY